MRTIMTVTLLGLLAFASVAFAGGPGEPLAEPKSLMRIAEALEKSGDDRFVSRRSSDGGSETYHLRSINLLGTIERGDERFLLAAANYVRSSPAGRDTPPARGHSYLVVFRPDFSIAAFCYESASDSDLTGNRLMREHEVVVDFGARDILTRHRGFLVGGGPLLPYFFADRITDEQWEDEEFMKRQLEAEVK
jgi:hypothetical protein